MRIQKEISFNAPDGTHDGVIKTVDAIRDMKKGECIRVVTEITSVKHPFKVFMARKVYTQAELGEFARDAEAILKDRVHEIISDDGEIVTEKFHIMEEERCKMEIMHIPSPKHDNPFCRVLRFMAPDQKAA